MDGRSEEDRGSAAARVRIIIEALGERNPQHSHALGVGVGKLGCMVTIARCTAQSRP